MKIIMATSNPNKVREINEMLEGSGIVIESLSDRGIDIDIEETGKTFEDNARIKAETISKLTGEMVLADDSGLVIDALDGAPGVMSSRFMGEDTPYDIKCRAIIDALNDVPEEKRTARFICSMALAKPGSETEIYNGVFEGQIAYEIKGENGFGYDPVFYLPEYGKTSAEISPEEKNAISHRGKALRQVVKRLTSI